MHGLLGSWHRCTRLHLKETGTAFFGGEIGDGVPSLAIVPVELVTRLGLGRYLRK